MLTATACSVQTLSTERRRTIWSVKTFEGRPLRLARRARACAATRLMTLGFRCKMCQAEAESDAQINALTLDDDAASSRSISHQAGNSGGPLITKSGEVIARQRKLTRRRFSTEEVPQNVNYASSDYISTLCLARAAAAAESRRGISDVVRATEDSVS